MIDFTIQTEIDRPVADVFAYVADPSKLPTWQTNTVSAMVVGGGEVGLGSRVVEVHRAPGGKEISQVVEFWEFEPNRRLSIRVVDGPVDPEPFLFMRRHVCYVMTWALKRQFAGYCATLKRVLEG